MSNHAAPADTYMIDPDLRVAMQVTTCDHRTAAVISDEIGLPVEAIGPCPCGWTEQPTPSAAEAVRELESADAALERAAAALASAGEDTYAVRVARQSVAGELRHLRA